MLPISVILKFVIVSDVFKVVVLIILDVESEVFLFAAAILIGEVELSYVACLDRDGVFWFASLCFLSVLASGVLNLWHEEICHPIWT